MVNCGPQSSTNLLASSKFGYGQYQKLGKIEGDVIYGTYYYINRPI